jgi:hypothetical protein
MKEVIVMLNADQLAQWRGCWPENECYWDCVEAARYAIENAETDSDHEELRMAREWADRQTWI